MRPPYSVLARRMGPGGAGAPRGARDVTNPNPYPYPHLAVYKQFYTSTVYKQFYKRHVARRKTGWLAPTAVCGWHGGRCGVTKCRVQ